jgi:hypothetical protein
MKNTTLAWKENWEETQNHFVDWWKRDGMVLTVGGGSAVPLHEMVAEPSYTKEGYGDEAFARTPAKQAGYNHYRLSSREYIADALPLADFGLGPGTLSVYLGAIPIFDGTVWYKPCITEDDPTHYPEIRFDKNNEWWKISAASARECAAMARGKYLVGCPDLIENIDTLAALRDTEQLLIDMVTRPEWVEQKLHEINQAWFDVYQRIYDIIKLEDGSSSFAAFAIWGPGKTAKVQCDASALFSPEMFDRFVVPDLSEQCEWLDNSLYHLDGHQCLCHLDSLLSIEALDCVEWTPDPQVPGGGDACWYETYRKILDAGKCVQAIGVKPEELEPLLDAVGGKGMYISSDYRDEAEAEKLLTLAAGYR